MPKDYFEERNAARDEVTRLRQALRDIRDVAPIPTPFEAFNFCRDVAAKALQE